MKAQVLKKYGDYDVLEYTDFPLRAIMIMKFLLKYLLVVSIIPIFGQELVYIQKMTVGHGKNLNSPLFKERI